VLSRPSSVASVQVAHVTSGGMPLVMRRLDSQHPFVAARTKIIYLMEASAVLDFDATTGEAIVLNGSSDVGGPACTSRGLGVLLWTAETRLRFSAVRPCAAVPTRSRGIRSHCGDLVAIRQLGACRVIRRCKVNCSCRVLRHRDAPSCTPGASYLGRGSRVAMTSVARWAEVQRLAGAASGF
jgi:hypothetical protein